MKLVARIWLGTVLVASTVLLVSKVYPEDVQEPVQQAGRRPRGRQPLSPHTLSPEEREELVRLVEADVEMEVVLSHLSGVPPQN